MNCDDYTYDNDVSIHKNLYNHLIHIYDCINKISDWFISGLLELQTQHNNMIKNNIKMAEKYDKNIDFLYNKINKLPSAKTLKEISSILDFEKKSDMMEDELFKAEFFKYGFLFLFLILLNRGIKWFIIVLVLIIFIMT